MLEIKTEGARNLAFVLSEGNGKISRDVVTIASGAGKLEAGTVLGRITASENYVASPEAEIVGKEGAETAMAVLAYRVDATSEDVEAVVIARHAEVKEPMLVFDASVDNASKIAAKLEQLSAATIIAR
ncbi:head decoration protein [Nitratireductor aquimarinus]|uniref:head decoration protein n=1 Tax=Nitratireductor TaxID=245876 RepID=UPI0019D3F031|nr:MULTISPECIES: head decoration protein [Nitratireductor]MBN7778917.1 head decoration protein [Nitratireductor pacificus]MBN7783198.1 head decoration protein [Nitratireductor pacificus]MBN7791999.1 head decoration protein [Nitratireductor aquimarinus]MCA1262908.1 head decoration protein [Nitratireductor aquimarinus]